MPSYFKKTKQYYCDTLLEMCDSMSLNSITATALIRRAGTSRQTFYNHFKDINDLISYLPLDYLESSGLDFISIENVKKAYEYALEHKSFFAQLPQHKGQNNFRETFIAALEEKFRQAFITNAMMPEERLRCEMSITLVVSGITDLFLAWCEHGLSWPLADHLTVVENYLNAFLASFKPNDRNLPADQR